MEKIHTVLLKILKILTLPFQFLNIFGGIVKRLVTMKFKPVNTILLDATDTEKSKFEVGLHYVPWFICSRRCTCGPHHTEHARNDSTNK